MSEYVHARCGGVLIEEGHHVRGWVINQVNNSGALSPSSLPEPDVARCEKCGRVGLLATIPDKATR
jgi:hypothetical protein